jgi:macrolide-specific efflux system membrane fusion protein
VVLYTALFDVANPERELLAQMSAQVFFVRAAARDVVVVPMAAVQFGTGGGGAGRAQGQGGGGARAGRGRRGQQNDEAPAAPADASNEAAGRPATVTVVDDDGNTQARDVVVGVSDRVNAAILSGLSEGEQVVAGSNVGGRGRGQQGGGGRGRGPVLFGG